MHPTRTTASTRLAAIVCAMALFAAACGSSTSTDTATSNESDGTTSTIAAETTSDAADAREADSTTTTTGAADGGESDSESGASTTTTGADDADAGSAAPAASPSGCNDVAAQFTTRGSANADLPDPVVNATCEGDSILVVSNGVPDFTYIGTSPGEPDGREMTFTIPAEPTLADSVTAVPYIGSAAVTLSGIPIFGPTEGTGGDVDSLPGIISACGSHNGPSGFHTHKILTSTETDCWFTPEEVAAAPQLVGYAFDGFPIYTGNDQYTSSWQLTDASLFASDTWAAHTYVEGSGDLDACNGRVDENGNYAYYTTDGFPYVLGCFAGEVTLESPGGDGGDDRPERPEGDAAAGDERPERPERPAGEAGDRPERPEGEAGDRPEPPADADA